MSTNVIVVVIAGASGSGKSSLARNVARDLAGTCKVSILHEDAYYRQQTNLELNQRALTNYDHPDAIEEALLVRHLKQLKSGQSVQVPVYDYRTHDRTDKTIKLDAPDVLIVEGILLLHRQAVRDLASISVFVDVAEETCLERRIDRDVRERAGRVEVCSSSTNKPLAPCSGNLWNLPAVTPMWLFRTEVSTRVRLQRSCSMFAT